MKHLTLFLLVLTAFSSYGQEVTPPNFKRFQIGINYSQDVCYRILQNNDGSAMSDLVIDSRNDLEIAKFGYTSGLNICYNISSFLGVETGLQYSNKGYQTNELTFVAAQPDPSIPESAKFIYSFHYVDIPVKVNFTVGIKRKMKFFSSVGVTTNVFIQETSTTVYHYSDRTERHTSPTNYDYKRVNLSPTVSAGIDYMINSRMNLRVEPTFRFGVLKIIDSPVTGYLYNGGLNVSYYFGL